MQTCVQGFGMNQRPGNSAWRGCPEQEQIMTIALTPLLSLIAGILILVVPGLLRIIVAIYLIAIGLIGLF